MMGSIEKQFEKNLRRSHRYSRFGLKSFPFSTSVDTDCTFGREDEFNRIGILVADLLDGVIPSIAILGYKGVGKTHFLKVLHNILFSFHKKKKIDHKPLLATNHGEFLEMYQLINAVSEEEKFLVLIDDAGTVWERSKEKLNELYNRKRVKLITVWHHASWGYAKRNHIWPIPKTQTEVLDSLDDSDIKDLLKFRIEKNKKGKNKAAFSDRALEIISESSKGVPYTALVLAGNCLLYALDKSNKNAVDEEIVAGCLTDMGLTLTNRDEKKIKGLTKKQRSIIKKILELTTSEKREISAIDIAKEMEIERAGVARHLRNLEREEHILDSKKEGRKRVYQIKPKYMRICEEVILRGNVEYSV